MKDNSSIKILYFVSEDWYFCSHRLNLAIAAKHAGYQVSVMTRVREHGDKITSSGLELIPLEMERHGLNPFADLFLLCRIIKIYRREKPDIVHQVAMKPVLYGSLAAWVTRVPVVINALAGMGYLFGAASTGKTIIKKLVSLVFRFLFQRENSTVIVQNPDDRALLMEAINTPPQNIVIVKGAGVDTTLFQPASKQGNRVVTIVLVARMLWDKGVGEFVRAAELLTQKGVEARYVLVGDPDSGNPEAIPLAQLEQWNNDGVVEWWGHCEDIAGLLQQADIACLPSYREGLPKSLIEAAAAGLPIVTTDVPGCREVVDQEKNGLLVPVKDYTALADALEILVHSRDLREQMGQASRLKVERELSDAVIIQAVLSMYEERV